ncbi:uncharacterized protein LOC121837566 [Ixodes scapularis]|uniref:uncharacterized protein LOC121837566 n=1 Tax=Ixodes scapularis TaxID=6945 RepID=UPI001161A3D7|nr:uncharacterized protein LOC121837566 [Ixodes scapularis]
MYSTARDKLKFILFRIGTQSGSCLGFSPSAAVRPGTLQLATRMNVTGFAPPPPFLATPGTPAVPWSRWLRLFENFLLASGANELPPARRQALLLHRLGPEGQRIFDALPQPTPNSPAAAATADEAGKSSRPDKPNPYDAAILTLTRHFAARCNVWVE